MKIFQVGDKTSLATAEGWAAYVKDDPRRPKPLTRSKYEELSSSERNAYDEARMKYHRSIGAIQTVQLQQAHAKMTSYSQGAQDAPPIARNGLMLSGPPRVGKTTIGVTWAKAFERELRVEHGWERTSSGALFLPVAYNILGMNAGTRGMMRGFLDFYGLRYKQAWGTDELTKHFADMAHRCGTQVVLIDQMQNLELSRQSDQEVSAHIKNLTDTCSATFYGMGVALETTGLFTEGKLHEHHAHAQIAGRFDLHQITAAQIGEASLDRQWTSFLRTVESKLMLFNAQPGDLCAELREYIYRRTGGVTGEVMDLLRRGANEAMTGREERMTLEVLNRVRLSHLAEQQQRPRSVRNGGTDSAALGVKPLAQDKSLKASITR